MIDLARASEHESPLGIEYVVGDARTLRTGERFDLAAAADLLNYAETEEALTAMCRTIGAALKPGGRFVTVNNDPRQLPACFEATRPYGFVKLPQRIYERGRPSPTPCFKTADRSRSTTTT
jgi:ubiquinone/menaquinone biosynthesis C-methylase UbiE